MINCINKFITKKPVVSLFILTSCIHLLKSCTFDLDLLWMFTTHCRKKKMKYLIVQNQLLSTLTLYQQILVCAVFEKQIKF